MPDATTAPSPADLAALLNGSTDQADDTDNGDGEDTTTDEAPEPKTEVPLDELPESWRDKIRELRRENKNLRNRNNTATTQQTTELEAAEAKGRAAARDEYGAKLAGAEIRARLAGTVPTESLPGLMSALNLSAYVDEGEVDTDAVDGLVETVTKLLGSKRTNVRVDQGRNGGAPKDPNAELHRIISGT